MKKKKAKPKKKPGYRGFLSSYSWKSARVQALNRDGCECRLCGSKDKLCVHHILYRRFYRDFWTSPLNLITLCKTCHFKVHKGVGNFLLLEYLKNSRPEQYDFVKNNI